MRTAHRRRGFVVAALAALTVSAGGSRVAHAGRADLNLLNLCEPRPSAAGVLNGQVLECSWVHRRADGLINAVTIPAEAEARFRSLMSELGVVMAPRLSIPAQTLGFAGFALSAELGVTTIHSQQRYWDGVDGVSPENPTVARPSSALTTAGVFVRKGIWLGLPSVELGAGVVNLLDSKLLSWQGYAKVALLEGFPRWPFPSIALRGAAAYLTGTDQVRMTTTSFDAIASKGFGVGGTFRLEPYAAWSLLLIRARSGLFDATPSCDSFRVRTAVAGESIGEYCAEAQRGTDNDAAANIRFPDQSVIRRQRWAAGVKIKFAEVFLTAQYDLYPPGRSRDGSKANGARDDSDRQQSFALSGGFDF